MKYRINLKNIPRDHIYNIGCLLGLTIFLAIISYIAQIGAFAVLNVESYEQLFCRVSTGGVWNEAEKKCSSKGTVEEYKQLHRNYWEYLYK